MKTIMTTLMTAVLLASVVSTQGRQTAPSAPAAPAPARPTQPPSPPQPPARNVNVRIDIVVIDEGGPQTTRENVTLITADRQDASLRSDTTSLGPGGFGGAILNVDATPVVEGMPTGKIRVRLAVDYAPAGSASPADGKPRASRTRLQFGLVLDDGKMLVASDVTDPGTDRRVKVEVTATLLK